MFGHDLRAAKQHHHHHEQQQSANAAVLFCSVEKPARRCQIFGRARSGQAAHRHPKKYIYPRAFPTSTTPECSGVLQRLRSMNSSSTLLSSSDFDGCFTCAGLVKGEWEWLQHQVDSAQHCRYCYVSTQVKDALVLPLHWGEASAVARTRYPLLERYI